MSVQIARSRLESVEEQLTHLSDLKTPTCRILRKIICYVTGHSSAYNGGIPIIECLLWEFRQRNTHSETINKLLIDEIMDFSDIIYRNNNYLENLYATGNNENKNMIFVQQLYIPKQIVS